VVRNGQPYHPAFDANGNITDYVATNGAVVAHYEFDAFGNTAAQSGTLADAFAYRFSTKYLDYETGLYYYGYRYYSPGAGIRRRSRRVHLSSVTRAMTLSISLTRWACGSTSDPQARKLPLSRLMQAIRSGHRGRN
jgi:uncharacterized protein RhaS with RHS repeats